MYLCKKSQSRIILQITINFQITTISLPAMAKDKQGRVSTTTGLLEKRGTELKYIQRF